MRRAEVIGPDELAIVGGRIEPKNPADLRGELEAFLKAWNLAAQGLDLAVWEYLSEIHMKRGELPVNYGELQRGRAFGAGGDLSLRRDGHRVLWHFIGDPKTKIPALGDPKSFWTEQKQQEEKRQVTQLRHQKNVESLLWGERVEVEMGVIRWHEDRVAAAELSYPGMEQVKGAERVKIRYSVYWHNGQPAFVWLRELVGV
jgi:hypothetical protein